MANEKCNCGGHYRNGNGHKRSCPMYEVVKAEQKRKQKEREKAAKKRS